MTPAREKAPVTDRKGTYNGWGQAPNSMVIDHLFVRNMKRLSYRTLDRRLRRALYLGSLSDRDRRAAEIAGYGR